MSYQVLFSLSQLVGTRWRTGDDTQLFVSPLKSMDGQKRIDALKGVWDYVGELEQDATEHDLFTDVSRV